MDRVEPPWAVVAFDRIVGMAIWYPALAAWVDDPAFLAPYVIGYESRAYRTDRGTIEDLIREGVGPPGKPTAGLRVVSEEQSAHLPTDWAGTPQ